MKSNNWNFDHHDMAVWFFHSKDQERKNMRLFIGRTIKVLLDLGVKSELFSLRKEKSDIEKLVFELESSGWLQMLETSNKFYNNPKTFIFAYNKQGKIVRLELTRNNLRNELKKINHFNSDRDYVPLPIEISLSLGKNDLSFTIRIQWDIWFEYVVCEPKWAAKYDANDLTGPEEKVDYRKHAFNNVELAQINGKNLNNYLQKIKIDPFISQEFNYCFYHTDQWPGYHPMTNANGVELLNK